MGQALAWHVSDGPTTSSDSAIGDMVRRATEFLSLAIWAIVGFFFWLPFLARAVAVFSSSVVYYTMTSRDASHLAPYLDTAINFYSRGFKLINSTFSTLDSGPTGKAFDAVPFQMGRVIVEIVSALIFWLGIVLLFKKTIHH